MSIPITLPSEDIEKIREMRHFQKRFHDGDKSVIGRCIALERKVDRILEKIPRADTPNLFSAPAQALAEETNDAAGAPYSWAGIAE